MNKRRNATKLAIIVFFVAFMLYVAFNGLIINYTSYLDSARDISLGIDLSGGIYAYLQPEEGVTPTREQLDIAKGIIEARFDGNGIYERSVMPDYTNNRIIVEIPWAKGETNFNPNSIIDDIGDIAQLTFRAVDDDKVDEYGNYLPTDEILVDGANVDDAYAIMNPETGAWIIALEFSKEGAEDFAEATKELQGEQLGIFLDETCISAPTVEDVITGGNATISGNFTKESAESLASKIKSGKLPFRLVATQIQSITPILGQNALEICVQAGFVSLLLVILFMVLYYRALGFLSGIALIANVCMQILLISWGGVVLTLPGIAGIILSIGMGVDSNIIIFERIKEELNQGKNIVTTVDQGFSRAIVAILDGNVTTLISAMALYIFGTGPVKGFAVTLALGVIINIVTDFLVIKPLLRNFAGLGVVKNYFWYGKKKSAGSGKEEYA